MYTVITNWKDRTRETTNVGLRNDQYNTKYNPYLYGEERLATITDYKKRNEGTFRTYREAERKVRELSNYSYCSDTIYIMKEEAGMRKVIAHFYISRRTGEIMGYTTNGGQFSLGYRTI